MREDFIPSRIRENDDLLQFVKKVGRTKVGVIKKFDSLEDLANNYNMPVEPFLAEVARWNTFVE